MLIRDESVLIYSSRSNAMHIFSIKSLLKKQPGNSKGVFSPMFPFGRCSYLNIRWNEKLTNLHNLQSNAKCFNVFQIRSVLGFPVVRDGVILYDENRTPELWNNDVTQCLATFDVLVGMKECFPVSDEVIACQYDSHVIFFNVFTREVESKTSFTEKVLAVHACSIEYHVLAQIESSEFSLWKNGVKVEGWENVFPANTSLRHIFRAQFSPQGNRVALFSLEINKIFIFDVVSLTYLAHAGPYLRPK